MKIRIHLKNMRIFCQKSFADVRVFYLLLNIVLRMTNIHLVKFLNQLNLLITVSCFPSHKFFVLKLEMKKKIV